jgi:hypothetical protein
MLQKQLVAKPLQKLVNFNAPCLKHQYFTENYITLEPAVIENHQGIPSVNSACR